MWLLILCFYTTSFQSQHNTEARHQPRKSDFLGSETISDVFQESFHDWAVHRLLSKYGGVEQGGTLCPLLSTSSAFSEICIWFTEKKRQEFGQIRHRGLNSRQKLPGKIDSPPTPPTVPLL